MIAGATWVSGNYGSALCFDGVDDLVLIADAADLDLTSAFTLEAWVRLDAATAARLMISKSETFGGTSGYTLSARYLGFQPALPPTRVRSKASLDPLPALGRCLVAPGLHVRRDEPEPLRRRQASQNDRRGRRKVTAANLEIGHNPVLAYFDGLIDEVRLYDKTLSEDRYLRDRPATARALV